MNLTDTGPLVALINQNDPNHAACVTAIGRLPNAPLLTTWPCFTEAMYLLFRAGGFPAQSALWRLRSTGRLQLHPLTDTEIDRMMVLMETYSDRPMDLADASIVAAAEHLEIRRLFTLDRDFYIYRLTDGSTLEVVP
ncbi:MAG: PIN domain nuclease [Cyanobacteria bacterium P01_G01_bin.54]